SLGLLIGNASMWNIDISKQMQINLLYDANGKLAGGSINSNGQSYAITASGAVMGGTIAPIGMPDYGAFKGSDYFGAASEGTSSSGVKIIDNTSSFIAKQLDKTAIGNAALGADTRGVLIEAAGIVGTAAGVALGGAVGAFLFGVPGAMSGAAVGAYHGNFEGKAAAKDLIAPTYDGYTYYDGQPYIPSPNTAPVTQAAGWYRIQKREHHHA
nr:hypothetical protein [Burkholderiaceae bacterium]